MVRFADFPQAAEVWSLLHTLEHIAVELHHIFFYALWLNFCERCVYVAHAFFDAADVGHAV